MHRNLIYNLLLVLDTHLIYYMFLKVKNHYFSEYSGAAEPPFRWRVSQVSGRN